MRHTQSIDVVDCIPNQLPSPSSVISIASSSRQVATGGGDGLYRTPEPGFDQSHAGEDDDADSPGMPR